MYVNVALNLAYLLLILGFHPEKFISSTSHVISDAPLLDVNECLSGPCVNGQCQDDVAGYRCQCNTGFTGNTCQTGGKFFTVSIMQWWSCCCVVCMTSYRRQLCTCTYSEFFACSLQTSMTAPA